MIVSKSSTWPFFITQETNVEVTLTVKYLKSNNMLGLGK